MIGIFRNAEAEGIGLQQLVFSQADMGASAIARGGLTQLLEALVNR